MMTWTMLTTVQTRNIRRRNVAKNAKATTMTTSESRLLRRRRSRRRSRQMVLARRILPNRVSVTRLPLQLPRAGKPRSSMVCCLPTCRTLHSARTNTSRDIIRWCSSKATARRLLWAQPLRPRPPKLDLPGCTEALKTVSSNHQIRSSNFYPILIWRLEHCLNNQTHDQEKANNK